MERWHNKVAVITGASAGIGAASCKALLDKGMIVVGLARRLDRMENEFKNSLPENQKNRFHAIKCDVSQEQDILNAFKIIEVKLGGVDILINNAGITRATQIVAENNTDYLKDILDVNVLGPAICTREAFRSMKKRGVDGHVILLNSLVGHDVVKIPGRSFNMYSPSKFAVTAMTEVLRHEFLLNETKVKVTVDSPLLETEEDSSAKWSNNNNHVNFNKNSTISSNNSNKNYSHHHNNNNNINTTPLNNISTKTHFPYALVNSISNSPKRNAQTANAQKRSTGNLTQPTTESIPTHSNNLYTTTIKISTVINGKLPLNETNRRNSTTTSTTTTKSDGNFTSTNPIQALSSTPSTTLDANSIILKNLNNNNNNNNKKDNRNYYQYAAPQIESTSAHTQIYAVKQQTYPNDFFANLEGQAPKPSIKMRSKVDAVGRITGEWGKWQLRTVLLIYLCKIPSSWFMACIIFTAPSPRHGEFFCKPPQTIGAQNQSLWIKVSHPQKEEADDQEFSIDFCNVYEDAQQHAHHYYNYENPDLEPKIWEEPTSRNANVIPCQQFHHQAEYHSVITQYDLVCSRDILVSVTQFFHLFGVLTGGILANHLLMYFSPRSVMLFGMITQIFCGNLTGLVSSYELHVFFRCLSAICCCQMYTAGGVIMADITGGKYKTYVSTLFEQFWSIGVILLPVVASFFESWSYLYMAISWPTVILIYLWRWIPDSPRWMIDRGRVLDAKKILEQCIEVNGTSSNLPHDIDQQLELQAQTAMDAPSPPGWWSIWKGEKAVRHMVCVHIAWSIYIVVYYGMLLNIRAFSRDHLEVNTAVAGLCEIIGTFIGLFFIVKTTRKWLWTSIFNIFAGLIAFTGWLVPYNIPVDARVALLMLSAMFSKIALSSTLAILTTCTTELVSDEKKKICAYSTVCWARFWLLGAPFVGATVVFGDLIPQMAFATLSIIGAIFTMFISSPRTIPKAKSHATQNMATSTQIIDGIDNRAFTKADDNNKAYTVFTNITKLTTPNSNLPPQLMPGIWTTRNHDDISLSTSKLPLHV